MSTTKARIRARCHAMRFLIRWRICPGCSWAIDCRPDRTGLAKTALQNLGILERGAGVHQLYIARSRHTRQAVKFTDSPRNSVPLLQLVQTRESLPDFRVDCLSRQGRGLWTD